MKFINVILAEIASISQSRKNLREFGIIFFIVGVVLSAISFYKHGLETGTGIIILFVALLFLASGLFFPNVLKPLHKIWMSLAVILAYFFTKIILFLSFFLIITPMGLLLRLIGKDVLDLKLDKPENTYWKDYETAPDKERYRKMF